MEVPSYKISKLKDMYNKIYTKFSDRYFLDSDEVFILIIFILIYHNQKIMVSTHVSSLSWECSVLMMGTWPQCPPAECEYERGWQTGDWGTRLHSLHSSQHNLVSQLLRIKQLFNNSDSTSSWHRWDFEKKIYYSTSVNETDGIGRQVREDFGSHRSYVIFFHYFEGIFFYRALRSLCNFSFYLKVIFIVC